MTPTNVVLITIDALRADHLSYQGYERETTPRLDSLAAKGANFRLAFSTSSHTRESIPSLLSGRWPTEVLNDHYAFTGTMGGEIIDQLTTGGFHSNPYLSRAFGYGNSFDMFYDDLPLTGNRLFARLRRLMNKLRNRYYARAEEINARSLSWVDAQDEPFFLWNHYMDVHGPYDPPDGVPEPFLNDSISSRRAQHLYYKSVENSDAILDAERQELINLYDAEIRVLDRKIGEFLDALQNRGLLSRTLVIITADHGEAFGEEGYFGHPRRLDDEVLHVPLLCMGPGVEPEEEEQPVSTIDVMPTILDALSEDIPTKMRGRTLFTNESESSLANSTGGRAIATARGEGEEEDLVRGFIRSENWRLDITKNRTSGHIVDETFYEVTQSNYRTVSDGEIPSQQARYLREHLLSAINDTNHPGTGSHDVPDEVVDRLKSLGYR